ncbi:hypothetical protein OM427_09420 [Halomonas sp. 18H]|uniref:hypothetical protein n=1 Tax=Halomonas almeriensis TaxID=308163 RepID=UPI0022314816|nr:MULTISPECIES: hypothetical protein [Halomonas]MCW4149747.1 hypothetical protein [Halomonas sp. 18H]MDN3553308.1 hypothetical protein [Halomonas almeriensis]
MEAYPDIEIYLAQLELEPLNAWLDEVLATPPLARAGKNRWRATTQRDGHEINILLIAKAADGFASLWFDSAHTPWTTDSDCAHEAARRLGCEVRCSLGGWQPGDEPDHFLQIMPDGQETTIEWPDSGQ